MVEARPKGRSRSTAKAGQQGAEVAAHGIVADAADA